MQRGEEKRREERVCEIRKRIQEEDLKVNRSKGKERGHAKERKLKE